MTLSLSVPATHTCIGKIFLAASLLLTCTQCARSPQDNVAKDLNLMAAKPAQQSPKTFRAEMGFDYYEFPRPDLGSKVSLIYRNSSDWWLFVENVKFNPEEIGPTRKDGLIMDGPLKGNYQISMQPAKFIHIMTPERAAQGFR